MVSEINSADLEEIKKSQETVTVEEIAKAQLNQTELQTAAINRLVDSLAAPIAGSKAPREIREFGRAVTQVGMTATDKTIGNQRGAIASIDKFYDLNTKQLIDAYPLSSEFVFNYIYANYNGDKRACEQDYFQYFERISDGSLNEKKVTKN